MGCSDAKLQTGNTVSVAFTLRLTQMVILMPQVHSRRLNIDIMTFKW